MRVCGRRVGHVHLRRPSAAEPLFFCDVREPVGRLVLVDRAHRCVLCPGDGAMMFVRQARQARSVRGPGRAQAEPLKDGVAPPGKTRRAQQQVLSLRDVDRLIDLGVEAQQRHRHRFSAAPLADRVAQIDRNEARVMLQEMFEHADGCLQIATDVQRFLPAVIHLFADEAQQRFQHQHLRALGRRRPFLVDDALLLQLLRYARESQFFGRNPAQIVAHDQVQRRQRHRSHVAQQRRVLLHDLMQQVLSFAALQMADDVGDRAPAAVGFRPAVAGDAVLEVPRLVLVFRSLARAQLPQYNAQHRVHVYALQRDGFAFVEAADRRVAALGLEEMNLLRVHVGGVDRALFQDFHGGQRNAHFDAEQARFERVVGFRARGVAALHQESVGIETGGREQMTMLVGRLQHAALVLEHVVRAMNFAIRQAVQIQPAQAVFFKELEVAGLHELVDLRVLHQVRNADRLDRQFV